jgi:signal transduction histidine kinase
MWLGFGSERKLIGVTLLLTAIGLMVVDITAYIIVSRIYGDIEDISQSMIDVVDNNEAYPKEEFRQGAMGNLYTNYYKMVNYLKESQEKEQAEKEFLRDIISDISHQLKTPLASLNVFTDMLLEDKVKDEERRLQVLQESKNQLNRMEWMVLSLLKLARIEAGAIEFYIKGWNLNVLLSQAAEGVRYLADKKNQRLEIICDEDIMLDCDGDWLTEGIINLLKNASDYSGENTTITLEAEKNNLFTRIYVKDKGMGIPESELHNIFKRFYRVNQEVNPNSVGIGLALTKSIVEGMGGRITVKSILGEYTWFELTFVRI